MEQRFCCDFDTHVMQDERFASIYLPRLAPGASQASLMMHAKTCKVTGKATDSNYEAGIYRQF